MGVDSDLIAVELAFINTSHPDFIGGDGALGNILDKMVEDKARSDSVCVSAST
jgi:hypothetical protein